MSGGERFLNGPGASKLIQDGFAIVGVSAQIVGVEGSPDHPLAAMGALPTLKTHDPARYETLQHPGDDYSYDIFTQAGQLLGPNRPTDVDPLGGLEVRHLIATGGSQSGARLGTYINGIHVTQPLFDAYLLVVYPNTPCALTQASAPAELPQTFGPNIFHVLEWFTYFLRDDLDVPIIVVNSESEASECDPNHQPDTEMVRWWEIPGTGHTSAYASSRRTRRDLVAHRRDDCFLRSGHSRRLARSAKLARRRRPTTPSAAAPQGRRPTSLSEGRARQRHWRNPLARPGSAARDSCRRTPGGRRNQSPPRQ